MWGCCLKKPHVGPLIAEAPYDVILYIQQKGSPAHGTSDITGGMADKCHKR